MEFSAGAPQADDITMLAMQFRGGDLKQAGSTVVRCNQARTTEIGASGSQKQSSLEVFV